MSTERDADDAAALLDRIEEGDRLWLRSPLGDARTVDVLAVEERAILVRDKTTDPLTGRVSEHRNRYTLRELRDAHAVGDLRLDVQRPAETPAAPNRRGL